MLTDHSLAESQSVPGSSLLSPDSIDFTRPDFPEFVWSAEATDHQIDQVADSFIAAGFCNSSGKLLQLACVLPQFNLLSSGSLIR